MVVGRWGEGRGGHHWSQRSPPDAPATSMRVRLTTVLTTAPEILTRAWRSVDDPEVGYLQGENVPARGVGEVEGAAGCPVRRGRDPCSARRHDQGRTARSLTPTMLVSEAALATTMLIPGPTRRAQTRPPHDLPPCRVNPLRQVAVRAVEGVTIHPGEPFRILSVSVIRKRSRT